MGPEAGGFEPGSASGRLGVKEHPIIEGAEVELDGGVTTCIGGNADAFKGADGRAGEGDVGRLAETEIRGFGDLVVSLGLPGQTEFAGTAAWIVMEVPDE